MINRHKYAHCATAEPTIFEEGTPSTEKFLFHKNCSLRIREGKKKMEDSEMKLDPDTYADR